MLQSLPLQQACHQERVKPMQHAITGCHTETHRLHMCHVTASVEAKRVQRQECCGKHRMDAMLQSPAQQAMVNAGLGLAFWDRMHG